MRSKHVASRRRKSAIRRTNRTATWCGESCARCCAVCRWASCRLSTRAGFPGCGPKDVTPRRRRPRRMLRSGRFGARSPPRRRAGARCIWLANPTVPGGILPVCPTKALLGIDCPGCGSPRMIHSLLHLDVACALRCNALGLVAVLLLVWAFAAWTYGRLVGQQVASWQHLRWSAGGPGADAGLVCGAQLRFWAVSSATCLEVAFVGPLD